MQKWLHGCGSFLCNERERGGRGRIHHAPIGVKLRRAIMGLLAPGGARWATMKVTPPTFMVAPSPRQRRGPTSIREVANLTPMGQHSSRPHSGFLHAGRSGTAGVMNPAPTAERLLQTNEPHPGSTRFLLFAGEHGMIRTLAATRQPIHTE